MTTQDEARRSRLWARYWRLLGRLAPSSRAALDVFFDRVLADLESDLARGPWLDAGCGRYTIPSWRTEAALREAEPFLYGCDLDPAALRERGQGSGACLANLGRLPFADETFALVTSNMVFEHLTDPRSVVEELVRVTRKRGRILVHTVNGRHYLAWLARFTPHRVHELAVEAMERRPRGEVYPTQYRANTVPALQRLFESCGCVGSWGGLMPDLPMFVPVAGLLEAAVAVGTVERRLARLPVLRHLLPSNIVVEFRKT